MHFLKLIIIFLSTPIITATSDVDKTQCEGYLTYNSLSIQFYVHAYTLF